MKKIIFALLLVALLAVPCHADFEEGQTALFGVDKLEDAVPSDVKKDVGKVSVGMHPMWAKLSKIFGTAFRKNLLVHSVPAEKCRVRTDYCSTVFCYVGAVRL